MKSNLQTKAKRLYLLVDQIKELTAEADKLKSFFKEELGKGTVKTGGYEVTIEECERAVIDREKLRAILSDKQYKSVESTTEYKMVKVRKVS